MQVYIMNHLRLVHVLYENDSKTDLRNGMIVDPLQAGRASVHNWCLTNMAMALAIGVGSFFLVAHAVREGEKQGTSSAQPIRSLLSAFLYAPAR